MTTTLSALCMTAALSVTTGFATQSSSADKAQMDKGMMKDGQTMVSGCVTAGKDSGKYMLTNAMMTGGMMDKGHTMDKAHMMSYELVGGTDLKAHLGHQVEVTGSLSKSDMDKMKKMQSTDKMDKDKMEKEKMDKMSDKDMKAMKLNVKSVKMTSSTCS